MKVICIDNEYHHDLTIGKEYDAVNTLIPDYYRLVNDLGDLKYYSMDYFISLDEYRNKKLKEIGI